MADYGEAGYQQLKPQLPMDPQDHPIDSGHNAMMNKGRAGMKADMDQAQEISDSVPRTGNTTSTNYSVQPGKSK